MFSNHPVTPQPLASDSCHYPGETLHQSSLDHPLAGIFSGTLARLQDPEASPWTELKADLGSSPTVEQQPDWHLE